MDQPRVDPSDWASRRKYAMNRAKEIRSKLRDQDCNDSSVERPLASKADLQRQRRSRQLEETQRLLDEHVVFFNSEPVNNKTVPRRAREEMDVKDNIRTTLKTGADSHSVISREQLGHIHSQYKNTQFSDISNESAKKSTSKRNESYGLQIKEEKMTEEESCNDILRASEFPSPTAESAITSNVRQRPLEGRGRGRGRGRIVTSESNASILGEMPLSSRSIPHTHQVSRWSHRVSQDTQADDAMKSPSSNPFLYFLRERQVPGYKEGECEKLAVLRRKLVARRYNSDKATKGNEKENDLVERMKITKSTKKNGRNSPFSSDSYKLEDENIHSRNASRTSQCSNVEAKYDRQVDHGISSNRLTLEDDTTVLSTGSVEQSKLSRFGVQGNEYDSMNGEDPVVDIKLIQCDGCKRSFAPKVYKNHFDQDGQPKCASQVSKKRPVYSSAKARIANNDNLSRDEQMQAIRTHKKVVAELTRKGKNGRTSKGKKGSKWREESNAFREAMKANRLIKKAENEGKPAHYYL